ncbi:TRM11 family SAM-dependent methyltransferase [Chloroflexota bacterium]
MVHKVRNSKYTFISRKICPYCNFDANGNLGEHIKVEHGEESYRIAVLKAKETGIPDPQIGEIFSINFKQLEKIITEAYGINISSLTKQKKIRSWQPSDFKTETTTVWSFRRRGDWATHDGRYRGNWSPYIPRNIILKYSKLGDVVLDYFGGGGTTAVEAKLLGRRCIARDINPAAIVLTKENLKFEAPKSFNDNYPVYEPEVSIGDTRELSGISEGEIDLICAHPPYSGIISYSSRLEGDLSAMPYEKFIEQLIIVAWRSMMVLKPGGRCAILIGDTRKKKHVIPIGFRTINTFLDAGLRLKELIIKRQHNCKTTGFWYSNSIKHNFLLLAYEYLAVFEKPYEIGVLQPNISEWENNFISCVKNPIASEKSNTLETTSVWVLPEDNFDDNLRHNIIQRYSKSRNYIEAVFSCTEGNNISEMVNETTSIGLLIIKFLCPDNGVSMTAVDTYARKVTGFINKNINNVLDDGFLVI